MRNKKVGIVTVPYLTNETHSVLATATYYSLHEQVLPPNFSMEFIAIVNHCDLAFESQIRIANDLVIKNDINCLARAWNKGIEAAIKAGCEYILIPNMDIIAHPFMLAKLIGAIDDNDFTVVSATETDDIKLITAKEVLSSPKFVSGGHYFCFLIKSDFFGKLGGKIYEGYKPCYFEDNEIDRTLQMKGFKTCKVSNALAWHYGSGTIKSDKDLATRNNYTFDRNKELYIERWGGIPGEEIYTTPYNE